MDFNSLNAISPIDGRYHNKTEKLAPYFSEAALFKYRTLVEIEYFIALCELPLPQLTNFDSTLFSELRKIYENFSEQDALKIKEIEKVTNHDVKAVEYFIKEKFDQLNLQDFKEFIHFGLTSQDINNTAVPHSLYAALQHIIIPELTKVGEQINALAHDWKSVSMLARTHGQPASPTNLGKEMLVFSERLNNQIAVLKSTTISGKFGGATGNFNAHYLAYPEFDWSAFGNRFLENALSIKRQQTTTQIEHYDDFAQLCDTFKRINNILMDLARDMWTYISMDYFKQKIKAGEVGSSAMPHKVNPIDFENAEGNFGIANAIFEHLSAKLPISRLQRDLTDSTVLRNVGVPFSHTLIAYQSLTKGFGKLLLNKDKIDQDLNNNWAVVAEAIQTVLRREAYPNPYEALKALTRTNEAITQSSLANFIDTLEVSDDLKTELKTISPFNYTGILPKELEQ